MKEVTQEKLDEAIEKTRGKGLGSVFGPLNVVQDVEADVVERGLPVELIYKAGLAHGFVLGGGLEEGE